MHLIKEEDGQGLVENNGMFVVSFTSGKGGVGKTLSAVNLAVAARNAGESVVIFDGDLGLANVDVVLGLHGRYNINDVLEGIVDINEVILKGPLGIDIIPSGSGFSNPPLATGETYNKHLFLL